MLEIKSERQLESGQQVQVYRNLKHLEHCFSIRDKKTGLVVAHADGFRIENVKCHVGKGRLKVIEEKRKNVHAYLTGIYTGQCEISKDKLVEVYYDPYTLDIFINKETKEKLLHIDLVYFKNGKAFMLKE